MQGSAVRVPQQRRSQQTMDRILSSSTKLISQRSYDDVSIAEIASHSRVSVGGFYSRFENKDALLCVLLDRLAEETRNKIDAALAEDWSQTSLRDLLNFVVENNAEIYNKYRGVLTAVHIGSRIFPEGKDDNARVSYNENIVGQIERLLFRKREEIRRRQPRVAIRTAIACMSAMLREAVVFRDTSIFPKPGNTASIVSQVASMMYCYLVAEKA